MKFITRLFTAHSKAVRRMRVRIALWLSPLLTPLQLLQISGLPEMAGGATNEIMRPGYQHAQIIDDPATPTSGIPVRVGSRTGIAMLDEGDGGAGATETVTYFGPGIFDLSVDDDLGSGIGIGDPLYYHDTQTGTPATSLNNKPAGGYFFGWALETVSANATTTINVAHSPEASRPGLGIKVKLAAGGAAGNITITGIAVNDSLISVLVFTTAASIASVADLTSEFSITAANTINNTGGTSTANNQLVVIYQDVE